MGGLRRGGAVDCVLSRSGPVSTAGELGVEGGVVEEVGDGDGRGRVRGSFTLPNKGTGTPGPLGWWWGPPWRGPKASFTVPLRGSFGGSPSNDDMRGGGPTLPPLGPTPPRSPPSSLTGGGTERGRSTGTSTPPTMTAEGTVGWVGDGEGCCGIGGGGGRGMGGGELRKGDEGGCWRRSGGGGVCMFSKW